MDYEKLIYTNSRGESLEFGVEGLYHCNVSKDVAGISDITNTIYSSNSMGQHGNTYIGQRIEARAITVTGHINTKDKTQAITLRREALKILNPELKGILTYVYGDYTRLIDCYIDDSPVFYRKSVLVQFDITFNCLNPFWREEYETVEDIASWIGSWEFPCAIDEEEGMIFGYREEAVIVNCYNIGDVSTEMKIRFTAIGDVENPILLNINTQEYIKINATIQEGDVLEVNTEYGNKYAQISRSGEVTDYFRYIDVDSTFMKLDIGDNIFRYDADDGVSMLEVTILYRAKYLGV